jgi:hypothetical protein
MSSSVVQAHAMRAMVSVLMMLLSVGVVSAGVSGSTVPPEIADLCRILKDQIVNKCECLPEVTDDLLGMPRPSGGGCDCGALECDSGDVPVAGVARIILEVTPAAPEVCDQVHWRASDATAQLASLRLFLRLPEGAYTFGQPTLSRPWADTSVGCMALPRSSTGSWFAVARAIDANGQESAVSNEVELILARTSAPPPPTTPPRPPAVVTLPPPLPRLSPPVALLPPLPSAPGSGRLSDTDVWLGRGATPGPSPTPPSGRLSDTCVWKGTACP